MIVKSDCSMTPLWLHFEIKGGDLGFWELPSFTNGFRLHRHWWRISEAKSVGDTVSLTPLRCWWRLLSQRYSCWQPELFRNFFVQRLLNSISYVSSSITVWTSHCIFIETEGSQRSSQDRNEGWSMHCEWKKTPETCQPYREVIMKW